MSSRVAVASGLRVPGIVAWPLLVVGLGAAIWGAYEFGRQRGGSRFSSSGPRIDEVREIARLAVLRVQVADVIEGDTAGARAAVLVKGDADMAVDLERIEIADRDEQSRTATLLIPTPVPERPRVDHDRTRIYELEKTGLALINPFADPRADLLADCMRAAQEDVERAVRDAEFVAQAKEQTERLLRSFYREWGWEVTVRWRT
jgi:hypothetical protein